LTREEGTTRETRAARGGGVERDGRTVPARPRRSDSAGLRGRLSPKRIAQFLAVIGAVIASLTQATSLIDWVSEKLNDPPAEIVAPRIVAVERQSPLSLQDYLSDTHEPLTGYTDAELNQKGFVFALTMHIQGEQGSRFALRWFIVDVDRGARLRGPSFNQEPAIFKPRNQNQVRTYPVWVPTPPRAGRFEVTFALVNGKGEPVAQKLTAPFRVSRPRGGSIEGPAGG
jgi:hypothetical protein